MMGVVAYRFKSFDPFTVVPSGAVGDGSPLSSHITRGGVFVGADQDAGAFAEDYKELVEWDSREYREAVLALDPLFYYPLEEPAGTQPVNLGSYGGSAAADATILANGFGAGAPMVRGGGSSVQWPDPAAVSNRINLNTSGSVLDTVSTTTYIIWKRASQLPTSDHYWGRKANYLACWNTPFASSNRAVARLYKADTATYTQAWALTSQAGAALNVSPSTEFWRADAIDRTDMVAVTYDGLTLRLYWNGYELLNVENDYLPDQLAAHSIVPNDWYLPISTDGGVTHPPGAEMGHAALWASALSAAEIADLWRVGCPLDA